MVQIKKLDLPKHTHQRNRLLDEAFSKKKARPEYSSRALDAHSHEQASEHTIKQPVQA
jgi:hypothetical protein